MTKYTSIYRAHYLDEEGNEVGMSSRDDRNIARVVDEASAFVRANPQYSAQVRDQKTGELIQKTRPS